MDQAIQTHIVKCLHSLYKFTKQKSDENALFCEIYNSLKNIEKNNKEKFRMGIWRHNESLAAQCIFDFINSNNALTKIYNISFFSQNTQNQRKQRYESKLVYDTEKRIFTLNQSTLIGRNRESLLKNIKKNEDIIDLPNQKKVSSTHIRISVKPYSDPKVWIIMDLKSKNGTYINGEKLSPDASKDLNSGDRITLGSPTPGEKYPEFVFESSNQDAVAGSSSLTLSEYQLICLPIKANQIFSPEQQSLIQSLASFPNIDLLIIAEESGIDDLERPKTKKNLTAIKDWIQQNFPKLSFQIKLLNLAAYYPGVDKEKIPASIKRHHKELYKYLEDYVKIKRPQAEVQVLQSSLLIQINRLEQYFSDQENRLRNNQERIQEKLSNSTFEELRWKKQRVQRAITDEREEFIQIVRDQLHRDLTAISSDNRPNSFPRKLKAFVNDLDIFVKSQGDETSVQLQTKQGQNIHESTINFCKCELKKWAEGQWEKVLYEYATGGLYGLSKRSYSQFEFLPSFSLENLFDSIYEMPNFSKSLDIEFLEMQDSTESFEENNSGGKSFIQLGIEGGTYMGMAFLNPSMAVLRGVQLASHLFNRSIDQKQVHQERKLKNISEHLQQRTFNYYQRLSRSIADEVNQDINKSLRLCERKFRRAAETTDERVTIYLSELQQANNSYSQKMNQIIHEQKILEEIKIMLG